MNSLIQNKTNAWCKNRPTAIHRQKLTCWPQRTANERRPQGPKAVNQFSGSGSDTLGSWKAWSTNDTQSSVDLTAYQHRRYFCLLWLNERWKERGGYIFLCTVWTISFLHATPEFQAPCGEAAASNFGVTRAGTHYLPIKKPDALPTTPLSRRWVHLVF